MTERKPISLSPKQQQLRQQRQTALERLKNAKPSETAPAAQPKPARLRLPVEASGKPPQSVTVRGAQSAPQDQRRLQRPPAVPSASNSGRPADPTLSSTRSAPQSAISSLKAAAPRRVVAPNGQAVRVVAQSGGTDGIRLNKRMAELGLCSRREGDAWIEKGWVTVNGTVAVMGQLVQLLDRIEIAPEAKGQQEQQVTILLNKPVGFVSGQAEDGHPPAVTLINPRTHWSADTSRIRFNAHQLKGLAPAGRLDIDSVGLLVLTQDGRVARQLIGEDVETEKEYLVRVTYATVQGEVTQDVQAAFPAERLALLRHGLSLDGEALKPAQVDWQNPEQLRFVLTQGKKRQIRRMCEQVGLKVVGLKRIRMGRVVLGNLPAGQWRYLGPHEQF